MQRVRLKAEQKIGFCATVLFPPAWNEAPAHRDKLEAGLSQSHDVDRGCRGDVVAGAQVTRRLGQPVKLDQFAPSVRLGEASAHGANLSIRVNCGKPAPRRIDHYRAFGTSGGAGEIDGKTG